MKAALPRAIIACRSGTAAIEMAMMAPILLLLLLGSFELGNYFLAEHVVVKAVRDGARYAARQGMTKYTCPSSVSQDVIDKTKDVVRRGGVEPTGMVNNRSPVLGYWTDANTITVSLACTTNNNYNDPATRDYGGIYGGVQNVQRVRVVAAVPYVPLIQTIGLLSGNAASLYLRADSEAVVMGL